MVAKLLGSSSNKSPVAAAQPRRRAECRQHRKRTGRSEGLPVEDPKAGQGTSAFTLIELIGVLTIIVILATLLVPVLIRQMDRIAGEQESASLKAIGDALEQSVKWNRYIPSETDWASTIAVQMGVNVSN